jgi:hypothetical protein
MKFSMLCASVFVLAFSQAAYAGSGYLSNVVIESIAVVGNTAINNHPPGNMEIKILNGFMPPSGMNCPDHNYIATREVDDPGRTMLTLLLHARGAPSPLSQVSLLITDDPLLNAYSGKCSLLAVFITQ